MAGHDIARDETATLIGSDKVEGTSVFDPTGDKLGNIHNFMVDKKSGQAKYAVLSFGGMLGMGADYCPVPWESLTYDTNKNGYVVDIEKEALKSGPRYNADDEPEYNRAYGETIHGHYGMDYPDPRHA
jgi:hypothetical protein